MKTHPHERRDESVSEEVFSPRFIETAFRRNEMYLRWCYSIFHRFGDEKYCDNTIT